ncbi:hypothetical protein AT727_10960 [Desulfitobacterium hafniense]|uniref:Uncharacterized protein n=1 Tax=Desulfitobacterium hafniense TaxID=49338 RepID=A0A0W1JE34_DESHA|nr:hypothetical protein AT727_10960 [Desulfitobacterium hafniense]
MPYSSLFFRLYRRCLSGRVGDLEKDTKKGFEEKNSSEGDPINGVQEAALIKSSGLRPKEKLKETRKT